MPEPKVPADNLGAEGKMPENRRAPTPAPTNESFLKALHDNLQAHHDEYTRRFGNVLNADNAATLFDDYNADPATNRVPVHEAASEIRDSLFEIKLAEPAPEGKAAVVLRLAGMPPVRVRSRNFRRQGMLLTSFWTRRSAIPTTPAALWIKPSRRTNLS